MGNLSLLLVTMRIWQKGARVKRLDQDGEDRAIDDDLLAGCLDHRACRRFGRGTEGDQEGVGSEQDREARKTQAKRRGKPRVIRIAIRQSTTAARKARNAHCTNILSASR